MLFSTETSKWLLRFFSYFQYIFLDNFIKNPQTRNAHTVLPLNISAVGSVTLYMLEKVIYEGGLILQGILILDNDWGGRIRFKKTSTQYEKNCSKHQILLPESNICTFYHTKESYKSGLIQLVSIYTLNAYDFFFFFFVFFRIRTNLKKYKEVRECP